MTTFDELSDAGLAEQITTWAGRVAAGEAHLLALIAEFDRRVAWAEVGVLSCAHWLSWRLGLGLKAAHERVRVARALSDLPETAAAFLAGRLSWTQVRAITRVATSADEGTYVGLARHATGAQLERLVRGVRRARKVDEDEADPEQAAHRMRTRVSYDDDGSLVVTMRLPAEQGAIVLAALEQARTDVDRRRQQVENPQRRPAGDEQSSAEDSPPATLSEAMLHLARTFLEVAAAERPDVSRRHRVRLVAHVDPLSGWGRLADGELLSPTSLSATNPSLDQRGLRRLNEADLTRDDLGRTQRLPGLRLRELLGSLDGERCRFPGCTRHRRLHAHHVTPWSDGGATDLANLLLLCSRHHTLVHRQGFRLTLQADRRLGVTTAAGLPVPHHPGLPWQQAASLDRAASVTPATLPPAAGDGLDLRYAVAVLMRHAA